MTIKELESKHADIIGESNLVYPDYFDDYTPLELESRYKKEEGLVAKEAIKLSLEFAIGVLEEINSKMSFSNQVILDKIQELKQYLNE